MISCNSGAICSLGRSRAFVTSFACGCTTAVCHNDAVCHNQRNLSQQVTQHVTIDAKYHNSNAKCHNAKYHTNFDFLRNMSHVSAQNVFVQNEEGHMEVVKFNTLFSQLENRIKVQSKGSFQ